MWCFCQCGFLGGCRFLVGGLKISLGIKFCLAALSILDGAKFKKKIFSLGFARVGGINLKGIFDSFGGSWMAVYFIEWSLL